MQEDQIDSVKEQQLIKNALNAREKAYAPYSNYYVGAALLLENGAIVQGCNVENASYGLCLCAERTAVATAVMQGQQKYRAIAIATSSSPPGAPCGMCRQVLNEFAPDLLVILCNEKNEVLKVSLKELLPMGFDSSYLK